MPIKIKFFYQFKNNANLMKFWTKLLIISKALTIH